MLEIGSGTGQHACWFAAALPDITWQPTELEQNIPAIGRWLLEFKQAQNNDNILNPLVLDVNKHPWPVKRADVCFTSNTFHIVSMPAVRSIFEGCRRVLGDKGKLCVYGPFSINGQHTSDGNEQFDQQLRAEDSASGIRDMTELNELAQQFDFSDCRKMAMPANNFMLVWETHTA